MNGLTFAKRNVKEIMRDPLSLIFCLLFPVVLFFVFQLILSNTSQEEIISSIPQFQINRLIPSICVFGFSFITLFSGMLISKDRTTSFLDRLKSSPLKTKDYIIGYSLPLFLIAIIQIVVVYIIGIFYGLEVNGYMFLSILTYIPISIIFISLGILLGSVFSDKSIGGVSSLIVNLSAILGGMFFPLENAAFALKLIAYIFPFANTLKFTNAVMTNTTDSLLLSMSVTIGYMVILLVISLVVFNKIINKRK